MVRLESASIKKVALVALLDKEGQVETIIQFLGKSTVDCLQSAMLLYESPFYVWEKSRTATLLVRCSVVIACHDSDCIKTRNRYPYLWNVKRLRYNDRQPHRERNYAYLRN